MLEEYKTLYQSLADHIPGWKVADKNDLCRRYLACENEPELQNQYFAAIICRYWGLIPKYYNISQNLAEPLDCYNWLVDAIMYTLKHKRWEDPDASISADPKGPDKMINRCMKCARLTYYQFCNRKKRRKEYQIVSLEEFREKMNSDAIDIEDADATLDVTALDMSIHIRTIFGKKEYFLAFLLDCICNEHVFEDIGDQTVFNIKRLAKAFRDIDQKYLHRFSVTYDLSYDEVYQAAILAKNIPQAKLTSKIEDALLRLKHSDLIKSIGGKHAH